MTITVQVPRGWARFAQQIGGQQLRDAVARFAYGEWQLPGDPGPGPEAVTFDFPDNVGSN